MDEEKQSQLQFQVLFGGNIPLGHVAVALFNCPITEVDGQLAPAFKLEYTTAIRIAVEIIHAAKMAERIAAQAALPVAKEGDERCPVETHQGQCILKAGHECNHAVYDS